MMIELLLATIAIYFSGLGAQILLFNSKKVKLLNFEEIFGLGFGMTGLFFIIFSILSIKFFPFLFSILTMIFFFGVMRLRKATWERIKIKECLSKLRELSPFYCFLVVVFFLFFLSLFFQAFSLPAWGYDAYALWLARARAFFIDREINLVNINTYWPPEHPPLWSFLISWFYLYLNQANELASRFLPLLFYLLMPLVFLRHSQENKYLKLIFIFFLMILPHLLDHIVDPLFAGNADLFLSFYFLLAVAAIDRKEYAKAGLFLSLGAWVKSEATPAVLTFVFLMMVLKIKNKLKPLIFALLPLIFLFGIKFWLGISSRYFSFNFNTSFSYFWYDLMAFREEMRNLPHWHLLWWLFLFIGILSGKRLLRQKNLLFAYLIIIFQLLSYFLIFLMTPENQAGHLASALFRLLLHLAPASLFLTFIQTSALLKEGKDA
jgi:hypothetical protein